MVDLSSIFFCMFTLEGNPLELCGWLYSQRKPFFWVFLRIFPLWHAIYPLQDAAAPQFGPLFPGHFLDVALHLSPQDAQSRGTAVCSCFFEDVMMISTECPMIFGDFWWPSWPQKQRNHWLRHGIFQRDFPKTSLDVAGRESGNRPCSCCGKQRSWASRALACRVLPWWNISICALVKTWFLSWPENYGEADKSDWGMSWLELVFNFYIVTGYNLPIRTEGSGAKSVYISYQSPEAILLPKAKRAASLQILTFRNLLQNLQTLIGDVFFPEFKESKCRSLQRLGHACPVAGVPRRPMIPRQEETITAVRQYIMSLQSSAALFQVIYIKDVQPTLQLKSIEDPPTDIRFKRYAQFMKKLRKTRQ